MGGVQAGPELTGPELTGVALIGKAGHREGMAIAVISDIHGNLGALDAVLADAAARGCAGSSTSATSSAARSTAWARRIG
ncbi:hypothetical protein ACFSLT_10050 [Novosphingobium resinovorum]